MHAYFLILMDPFLVNLGFTFMLGSFCLVAITDSDLGIIYNHDDNNDDTTAVLSMFMRYALLIQDHMFNRNMENHLEKQCNLGMAMGRVRVGWSQNPTHEKMTSGRKLNPHPHPWVEFCTHARTHRVSGRVRVPVEFCNHICDEAKIKEILVTKFIQPHKSIT
jgi:hypothetical protein